MKRIMVTLSDEGHGILSEYKKAQGIKNLDTALDEFLKEKGNEYKTTNSG